MQVWRNGQVGAEFPHRDLHAIFRRTAKLRAHMTSQRELGYAGVVTTPTSSARSEKSGEVRKISPIESRRTIFSCLLNHTWQKCNCVDGYCKNEESITNLQLLQQPVDHIENGRAVFFFLI
jgi:hypothetical protein